ncbi:hypothetical protein OBBRIDRAFT_858456, partial [Obba rivulosa]
ARPCDASGNFLPEGTPPFPSLACTKNDWSSFNDRIQFETVEFIFTHNQMSAGHFKTLNALWMAILAKHHDRPPFKNIKSLYKIVDSIPLGDAPWWEMTCSYTEVEQAMGLLPKWETDKHHVWYRDPRAVVRNLLSNPDFDGEFDYTPICDHTQTDGLHRRDFMSGDWAWNQANIITRDEKTHGSMFVLLILRSDKTTVSVAIGQNEYYPLYTSIRNVHNNVRCVHQNTLVVIGFLAIPQSVRQHVNNPEFCKFKCELFHTSIKVILSLLKNTMENYVVLWCPDDHFRHVILGLGLFIGDYPEQALATSVVQGWCPKQVIYSWVYSHITHPCYSDV